VPEPIPARRPDGWLDTGDVGCLLDGELAVVGRAKDLIVVRGRNHAPQDLEWAAEGVPGVRPGSAAAFGTWSERDATERDGSQREGRQGERPIRILWPHRWEYDKNPKDFFDCMLKLHREGAAFELVLVGEQFRTAPPEFASAIEELTGHIVHAGYLESRSDYLRMVKSCDVVVSTAIQENFGIAIVEQIVYDLPQHFISAGEEPPVLKTANLPGGDEWNANLIARYGARVGLR